MSKKKKNKPTLNKSNIKKREILNCLIFLLVLFSYMLPSHSEDVSKLKEETKKTDNELNVIITPENAKQGDVVSVKIEKDSKNNSTPKVFFDKTKYSVFELSDKYYRSLLPITANYKVGKYTIEVFYKGKVKRIDLQVSETKYPLQELTLTKEVAALQASKIEKDSVNRALSNFSPKKLWTGKFLNPSTARQSTIYGVKRKVNGVINPDYFHKGLDFAAKEGGDIKSPEDGVIVLVGQNSKGFIVNGNCVFIDHGQSVISGYLHLSKVLVKEGEFVKKGQIIGKVGSTGIASGPHLHWGIYISGKTVDPVNWTSMIIE